MIKTARCIQLRSTLVVAPVLTLSRLPSPVTSTPTNSTSTTSLTRPNSTQLPQTPSPRQTVTLCRNKHEILHADKRRRDSTSNEPYGTSSLVCIGRSQLLSARHFFGLLRPNSAPCYVVLWNKETRDEVRNKPKKCLAERSCERPMQTSELVP